MAVYCEFKKISDNTCQCIHCNQILNNINDCNSISSPCNIQEYREVIKEDEELVRLNQGPSRVKKFINFLRALRKHIKSGRKYCSKQQIKERLTRCKKCELFSGETCLHYECGCNITDSEGFLNKLSWKSEECPLKKWLAFPKD